MSKKVLFIANFNTEWMGGVYYIKNILYPITSNKNLEAYIYVNENTENLFQEFKDNYKNIKIVRSKRNILLNRFLEIFNKILKRIIKRKFDLELNKIIKENQIDFIYPIMDYSYLGLEKRCINWIPDFQHIHLPHIFTEKDIKQRNKIYKYLAKNHFKLILSSEAVYSDYKRLYPDNLNNVHVCHFLSNIENEISTLEKINYKDILKKYSLDDDYVIVSNQFWQHKNHIVVFKAMNELVKKNKDIKLVCTGNTKDYRNKNYFNELLKYIKEHNLENNIIILGLIPRMDQLVLMAYSNVVIQPSLFEGWNTSVEEAKILNKKILISNINTHLEQADKNCICFKKNNFKELANLISDNYINENKVYKIDYKKIEDLKKQYSMELEYALN